MALSLGADDIHVLQTSVPIEPQTRQVLAKKPETVAKKKNRNQCEHHDCDERVAPEKGLDGCFGCYAAA